MKRRTFFHQTALAAAGGMLMPAWLACTTQKNVNRQAIGLQLWTLSDIIFNDVPGTLKRVSDIGYTEIETYSYGDGKIFGQPFGEYVKMASDLGLKTVSGHYETGFNKQITGNLRNGWEQAVADAKQAGQSYMIIASLETAERQTLDQYKQVCELMNKGAEVCKSYGMKLGYHNHDFEFIVIDNQLPYDVMLAELDPSLVCMQLDLYWIVRAGYSPTDYISRHPGRFELWHVKDMDKNDKDKTTDLGTGTINFEEIFSQQQQSGLKHFFAEQEDFGISSLESVKKNYDYLRNVVS